MSPDGRDDAASDDTDPDGPAAAGTASEGTPGRDSDRDTDPETPGHDSDPGPGGIREPAESALPMRVRVLRVIPIATILLVFAFGLVLALLDHWRRGSAAMASAAALAAMCRLFLPTRVAGVLAVRSRAFDVIFLLAVTAALGTAALLVVTPGR